MWEGTRNGVEHERSHFRAIVARIRLGPEPCHENLGNFSLPTYSKIHLTSLSYA